jgi:uncharacterized membrane protein YdfJ with MMPL/SSD domain
VHRFFTCTGRFAVRFRWAIVAAWVAAAVLANLFFPSAHGRPAGDAPEPTAAPVSVR